MMDVVFYKTMLYNEKYTEKIYIEGEAERAEEEVTSSTPLSGVIIDEKNC